MMPRVNIYIPAESLRKIDRDRGGISRSAYLVRAALDAAHNDAAHNDAAHNDAAHNDAAHNDAAHNDAQTVSA
jgi:hypothetical protein